MIWFIAVQGTIKSLLQHHSSKPSILLNSVFTAQLALPFMTTRKNISSVQLSCSVMSDSLRHHKLQHARHPCLSPAPGIYSNSCPLSWQCHPTISSSVVPFSHLQSFNQHQGLFKWVNSSQQVAKLLEFQL